MRKFTFNYVYQVEAHDKIEIFAENQVVAQKIFKDKMFEQDIYFTKIQSWTDEPAENENCSQKQDE